ncbi:MAG TPA: hypothetical protein VGC07_08345 [Granulicella sp.]
MAKRSASPRQRLQTALVERDVRAGFALLDDLFARKPWPGPLSEDGFAMIFSLAQWADLGYRDLEFFEKQLKPFRRCKRSGLRVSDYLALLLAEAYSLFAHGKATDAALLLESLLRAHAEVLSPHEAFVAWFWKGRAHRIQGAFDDALVSIRQAKQIAVDARAERLVASAKIHESWLLFYRGERRLAFELLDQAERTLQPTGHALSLGNIAAARGRFHRSAGDYDRALSFFEQALQLYHSQVPTHTNLARALVNTAYVKRLQALTLQPSRGGKATAAVHASVLQIVHEAMEMLREAQSIYAAHQHYAGLGSVRIHMGHLHLESGDIDAATVEADAAYSLGEARNDVVMKARARILQAYVEMARAEEQIDSPRSSGSPAQHAVELAEDALALAQHTHNRRLVAAAHITRGLAATDATQADWDVALRGASTAAELLNREERDHLFNELNVLRKKIAQSQTLDHTWRRWVSGDMDGKTYGQIEEDFAAIIIPQVWMKLGQNITRVAQHLSISPKKVRRALRNAQMITPSPTKTVKSSGRNGA